MEEYQFQTLSLYAELHEIYGTGTPPGKWVTSMIPKVITGIAMFLLILIPVSDDGLSKSEELEIDDGFIDPNLMEDWISRPADIITRDTNSNDDEVFSTPEASLASRKRTSSLAPLNGTPASKSTRLSVHQSAAKLAKEGMQELGECMKAAMARSAELPGITRFDQCLPLLSQMREVGMLDKGNYLKYCQLLRSDKTLVAMFVGMDSDLRLEWLELELELLTE